MTFYNEEERKNIIKTYTNTGYNYTVEYLDGVECNYYCTNENKKNELEKKMIEQAENRDKEFYDEIDKKINNNLKSIIFLLGTSYISCKTNAILLLCISLISLIMTTKKYFSNKKKLKELKKYRLLLSIYSELKKEENKSITDILEFDKIYQTRPNLNIATIDEFSLKDVEIISEELIKRKELKNT